MKNFYERDVYESVDETSLSWVISWISMKKRIWSLKGQLILPDYRVCTNFWSPFDFYVLTWFRQGETSYFFSPCEGRHELLLLFLCAKLEDGADVEAVVGTGYGPRGSTSSAYLLDHEGVGQVIHARPSVFLWGTYAHETKLPHLLDLPIHVQIHLGSFLFGGFLHYLPKLKFCLFKLTFSGSDGKQTLLRF